MPKPIVDTSDQEPVYLGIDPGKKGAFAALFSSENLSVWRMPEDYSVIPDILEKIRNRSGSRKIVCTVEKVRGYIGGGFNPGAAMFVFGQGFGHIQMAISICSQRWKDEGVDFRYTEVEPSRWVAGYNMKKNRVKRLIRSRKTGELREVFGKESDNSWKNRLLVVASELYPSYQIRLEHADAVLLAHYGKMKGLGSGRSNAEQA